MKRKSILLIVSFILIISLLFSAFPISLAGQNITITLHPDNPYMTVNGVKQEIDPGRGTKPVIIPEWSRTVVPIRAIVETLGGTIDWEGTTRKVTINFEGTVIYLWIDNPKAEVNGITKWIDTNNHDVEPIIRNDRTMLPLRFVAESLGAKVDWEGTTRTITITYPKEESKTTQFKGNGDDVTSKFNLQSGIAIISMKYVGKTNTNFAVDLMDNEGNSVDLLANEIGSFIGTKAIGVYEDNIMGAEPGTYLFNVTAGGNWEITVTQPVPTTGKSLPSTFRGKGCNVTSFFVLKKGLTTFNMTHDGESNFIVSLLSSDGKSELLANEIGTYSGKKAVGVKEDNLFGPTPGIYLISVTADGNWTISIDQ